MIRGLRYAIRGLLGNPGFAAVVILTIGIGIGANATMFSWMHNVLLNPLPAASDPGRIVAIENTADNGDPLTTSFLDYTDYRDHLHLVDSVTLKKMQPFVVGEESHPERVWGEMVSGNFFELLGVRPEIGRFFNREESGDEQNAHPMAVISHSYWMTHYHRQSSVVGAKLRLDRTVFTIIGVAPKPFHGSWAGLDMQIWVPITMYGQVTHTGTWMLRDRNARDFMMLARLKPGVTIEQARAEAKALADLMANANAYGDQGVGADVLPLWKSHFGSENILLTPITILVGASGLMLLIVCANVANLLLARVTARRKELRHSHGSGREAGTSDPGTPDRSLAACPGRLACGSPPCELAEWFACMVDSRSLHSDAAPAAARRQGSAVLYGPRLLCGTGGRIRTGFKWLTGKRKYGLERRCARLNLRGIAPPARFAGGRRGQPRRGGADRRRIVPPELPKSARHEPRVRP